MYKTILVHADESAGSAQRIEVAARLAKLHGAHLVGAATTGVSPYAYTAMSFESRAPAVAFPLEELRAEAERALDLFERSVRQAGVDSFERRRIDDEAGMGISMHARYCDLLVISQTDPGAPLPRLRPDFPDYVLLNCMRPVLVLPSGGISGGVGRRVTVAWNGSVEATRAITSAIPLLQRAEQVDLVVFDAECSGDLHGEQPGADMALYLARHGVRVEVTAAGPAADVGEALLSFALDKGAGLIVMGAFGHSRFREVLIGGATRTALLGSPIAMLFSH